MIPAHTLLDPWLPWLTHYGTFAIFILLALGIIALPIPEESLMVLAGFLVAKGSLHPVLTVLAAVGGSWCGITCSYFLGLKAGNYCVKKVGRYVGLTDARLEKAHRWFERVGKWSLSVGYFVPGFRHLIGYVAGTVRLEYKQFALFAYAGGFVWAMLFLSIGFFFSYHDSLFLQITDHY